VSALACGREKPLDPTAMGTGTSDAGAEGGADLTGPPLPPAPAAGDWLLYGFEDPVAVHIEVGPDGRSYDVTGTGCWNGSRGLLGYDADSCGELHGHGAGLALAFVFVFPRGFLGGGQYAASVHVSQDGTRMAGTISTRFGEMPPAGPMGPFGWLRLGDIGVTSALDQGKAPPADLGPLPNASWTGPDGLSLALQGDVPLGALLPGKSYWMQESSVRVYSFTHDLGVFWNPDFHWDEATRTLTAGPVSETIPGMPVKLEFHVDAVSTVVHDVVATLADGTRGTFLPVNR
jgi:hypothetical protein